jgi:hypothetical protein
MRGGAFNEGGFMPHKRRHNRGESVKLTGEEMKQLAGMSAHSPSPSLPLTLTGLKHPFGEVDAKVSLGKHNPVLMFPNRAAFRADIATLSKPNGECGGVELLGWIDRQGFDRYIEQHGLDPTCPIQLDVDELRPMREGPTCDNGDKGELPRNRGRCL